MNSIVLGFLAGWGGDGREKKEREKKKKEKNWDFLMKFQFFLYIIHLYMSRMYIIL